jgi:hypothetical protein
MKQNSKIDWENRPDQRDATSPFKLFRVPAKGVYHFYILGTALHGVRTHFFHGRTFPHLTTNCPACEEGIESRWRGYLSCCNRNTKNRMLVELTAGPAGEIVDLVDKGEALRGRIICLSRPGGKANSRISIDIINCDCDPKVLPASFEVEKTLLKIWQIQDHMTEPQLRTFISEQRTKKEVRINGHDT